MNAVIYARFSSDRQREESIEGQIRECCAYADKHDINIVGEYIDRAKSASKDTVKRENFLRMISDSSNKNFDAVLVWKLDRFARDRYDSAHYKHILKKNNVKLVSVMEPIADGPEGILLEALIEGMAEYYSAELSIKVKRGHTENALKCRNNGGHTPLGYKVVDHKLIIDPSTAPVVQEIYQRYADGETIREIIDDLNTKGLRTSKGNKFTHPSFNTLLQNRVYIGEYIYDGTVISDGVPAIVSKEIFDKVQARRERNKRAPASSKTKINFLLTTKLFCGNCGKMMVGDSGKSKTGTVHYYYKCGAAKRERTCNKKAVRKDWIENIVIKYTMLMLQNKELMERLTDRLYKLQGTESSTLKLLKKQLKDTNKGIENMLNAIQAGIITAATKDRLTSLEDEKAALEKSIAKEQAEHPILTREQIQFFLDHYKYTDVTDPVERQRLIDCFVNAVYLYEDKIILTYNYKDGTETISLADLESSDLIIDGSPKKKTSIRMSSFFARTGIERQLKTCL